MTDITESFLAFRECARTTWNQFFRRLPDGEHGFTAVERELFNAMVYSQAERYEAEQTVAGREYAPRLRVVPRRSAIEVLVGTEYDAGVVWTSEAWSVDGLDLRYSSTFDFDTLSGSFRDFRYVEALVLRDEGGGGRGGKRILIEVHEVCLWDVSGA